MVSRQKIVDFLNKYLDIESVKDSSYNGLQFEGKTDVNKIIFAVDTGIATFEKAIEHKADMVVVHHGQFWNKKNPSIVGHSKQRFKILFENDISLYAAHLPLDKHPVVGNNAQLLNLIGAKIDGEFCNYNGQFISWIGTLDKPKSVTDLISIFNQNLKTKCLALEFGKKEIQKIALCSGGGSSTMLLDAIEKGVDLYISGEPKEVFHLAKDAALNVIFIGHHASETVGVKALSKVVKEKFKDLEVEFVDIPTGL